MFPKGVSESGMDAGGLFKEFWTELAALAFNMDFGLFSLTSEGLLYPNPNAQALQVDRRFLEASCC